LLAERLIPARIDRGVVVPFFLTERDHPWLGILIEEIDRFRGRPRRELGEHLRAPLPCAAPFMKSRAAALVLLQLWKAVENAVVSPAEAREAVFLAAAARPGQARASVLAAVADGLDASVADVEAALFADLPGERIIQPPEQIPSVPDAALRVNLAIARSLLSRATVVRIRAEGSIRPVVRQAQLRGLLCTVPAANPPEIEISGPFALFRRTLIYGRALGELLPFLTRTARFELRARCCLGGREGELTLRSSDPIQPAGESKTFDSRLEARFAKDFKRAAPDWDLLREPEVVRAGDSLIFPDFLVRHRLYPRRAYLIEIVGFWTTDYINHKLARLRAAKISNLILVIDEDRRCADGELPVGARVVWYRRRIDPAKVLALLG
jgi:predicted nuclease of restriction endonuclease-like RecB superfamily